MREVNPLAIKVKNPNEAGLTPTLTVSIDTEVIS
jgi:hypothetical protein